MRLLLLSGVTTIIHLIDKSVDNESCYPVIITLFL